MAAVTAGVAMLIAVGAQAQTPPKKFVAIGTGGTGGGNYVAGAAISSVLNKYLPTVNSTAEATAGTVENIRRVQNKEMLIGFATGDSAYYAMLGEREFKTKSPDLRAMFRGQDSIYLLLARKDARIATIADLKGKRVSIGPKGGGLSAAATLVFAAHGLKLSDFTPAYLSYAETATGLQDKTLDAGYFVASGSAAQDVTNSVDVVAIPFDTTVIDGLVKQYPFFANGTIPGGVYKGIDKPVPTWNTPLLIMTHKDADPQLIYDITKTVYTRQKELLEITPLGEYFTPKNAVTAISIPFHPAAERYFKEIGALK
jgi:TRAP transporter TAXI family solute receptor